MSAVWARARAELRRRAAVMVVLAVLTGLAGGVVLAAVAGARRTESALGRFLAYHQSMDVFVVGDGVDLAAVQRLPQVQASANRAYMALVPPGPSGRPDPAAFGSVNPWAPVFGPLWTELDRPLLVAGRSPDPARPLEVAVNERLADRWGLRPGSTFPMWAYTPEQLSRAHSPNDLGAPAGPAFRFTVTGIQRRPDDINSIPVQTDVEYMGSQDLFLTPAFWRQHARDSGAFNEAFLGLRLRGGPRDFPAFAAAVRQVPGGAKAIIGAGSDAEAAAGAAQRGIHLEAAALLVFAGLAALASLLVLGQALARQVQLGTAEHPALRAIGMTRAQLVAVPMVLGALLGAGGAVVAVAVAVALSPLTPLGLARQAEIDPGLAIDPLVLAVGGPAVLLAVLARTGLTAWWATRAAGADAAEPGAARPSAAAERLARSGAPPSAAVGVRMALDPGRGAGAVPVRSALAGAVAAVVAVAASLTVAASLGRLVRSPDLQGWNWDVVVGSPHDTHDLDAAARRALAGNPLVAGFTLYASAPEELDVGGRAVPAVGLEPLRGAVLPRLLAGREARTPDEIVLGHRTLRRLGKQVGDTVEAGPHGGRRPPLRIVGEALLSPISTASSTPVSMGEGAVLTLAALRALQPDTPANLALVTYAPGADREAAYRSLQRDFGHRVLRPLPPATVANMHRVGGLPVALAALLAVLGLATLAHTLVTSTRRRRRDLAVLKTLGFVRGQVWAALAWQATTLVALALLIGLPLGIAVGRWAWYLAADSLQSPAGPVVPALALLLAVPAAVAVVNATAAFPAMAAARTRPALVLRSE